MAAVAAGCDTLATDVIKQIKVVYDNNGLLDVSPSTSLREVRLGALGSAALATKNSPYIAIAELSIYLTYLTVGCPHEVV
jgi:hypothetical protein